MSPHDIKLDAGVAIFDRASFSVSIAGSSLAGRECYFARTIASYSLLLSVDRQSPFAGANAQLIATPESSITYRRNVELTCLRAPASFWAGDNARSNIRGGSIALDRSR